MSKRLSSSTIGLVENTYLSPLGEVLVLLLVVVQVKEIAKSE